LPICAVTVLQASRSASLSFAAEAPPLGRHNERRC
jgi:hypothetical protein